MEDRDNKKPFIIPKTRLSNKDVLISEKTDSRNAIELFNDIKSCALELHFDFRQNDCQSCDLIRNQKLQKLYNERKIQMKKDRDPIERFAFHLITSRDIALNIATDGLSCEQLSFSIDKYLGNPKDGIHLSRRPDVLLASSGIQGLTKFGLLVCKILLGKGYATIPSVNNKQLSAQLHNDYHFCKIQPINKEQRHIDDLLGNSLIFCYEHEDFRTLSHPTQILPLAILWYDLKEKFSSELTSIVQEPQPRNVKTIKIKNSYKNKPLIKTIPVPILSSNTGTWDNPTQNTDIISTTPIKYPNHLMFPYPSLYTSFSNSQEDPRLIRTVVSSETIPLSPLERSQSDLSLSSKQIINEKKFSLIDIPLNSTIQLIDPRLKTIKQTQNIFYLESKAVQHALQQQKRLNQYYDLTPKTNYTLIPFIIRSISSNEYERNNQLLKSSSSLQISVIDCFHFGFKQTTDQLYIDLDENENQLAYEQIQISNQLILQEQELNSQEIRLHLREKRQRKIQESIYEQKKKDFANSKIYIHNGRKLLKERQIVTPLNKQIPGQLLDFFSYEYQHENRPHVKRILAELAGIFNEKYGSDLKQNTLKAIEETPIMNNQLINSVVDMELESPSSEGLGDHDERFRVQTPPMIESIYNPLLPLLPLIQTYNEPNQTFDESNNNDVQSTPIELPLSELNPLPNDVIFKTNIEQTEFLSNENNGIDDNLSPTINDDSNQIITPSLSVDIDDDSNRSRNEFVKLLTKEAYTSKSPSPCQTLTHRRQSIDNDESNANKTLSSTRTVTIISNNHEDNLIIETTSVDQLKEEEEEEEEEVEEEEQPTVKRIKVDLIVPPNDDMNTVVPINDDYDYRYDLDERKRQAETLSSRSRSKSTSSHNSSIKDLRTRSPSPSPSRAPSNNDQYRRRQLQQQHRRNNTYKYGHKRSSNKTCHYYKQNQNNSISPHSQPLRHQRFNYNHQSVAEHPRFAHVDTIPSPEKNPNYNPFETSNYSQPMTNTNRNLNSSYYNESNSNYPYYEDNYNNNNFPQPPPLMSTMPIMNYSNSYDSKPSNAIERLQMLLENTHPSITDYSSSSYTMYPPQNSTNSHWSSSRYSSRETTQNNQTFTGSDAEQLLTYVQHLRN